MPKISIITTTYKHEDFIKYTIESILSQTFTDWELLIGDDSPDDKTRDIIKQYLDKYPGKIKAWHHSPNKGIVDNMNFLLEKVNIESEYIAFLEGDDLYTPDNLEEKLKIFEKYPEVRMVYNDLDFIDENGNIIEKGYFSKVSKILKNEKLNLDFYVSTLDQYFSYSSMMLKKEIFKNGIKIQNPKNDLMYLNSDCIFFADVGYSYNVYGLEKKLTLYRKHSSNSSKKNIKLAYDNLYSLEYLLNKYNFKYLKGFYYSKKSFIYFIEDNKIKSIYYGIISFIYKLNYNIINRLLIIFLSMFPRIISKSIFNYYRLKKGKELID